MEVIVTGKAAHDLDEWLSRIEADNPGAAEAFRVAFSRLGNWTADQNSLRAYRALRTMIPSVLGIRS